MSDAIPYALFFSLLRFVRARLKLPSPSAKLFEESKTFLLSRSFLCSGDYCRSGFTSSSIAMVFLDWNALDTVEIA